MDTPWLSIVIPVYNAESYLAQCLDSILAQTHTNFEVILVDDGSLDGSPQICNRYASQDSRIHYLRKENRGPLHTRIYGVKHTSGSYITFCDADDFYTTPNAFSRMYEELKNGTCSVLQFHNERKFNHLKFRKKLGCAAQTIGRKEFLTQDYPKLLCSFWEGSRISCCVWNKVYHRNLLVGLPEIEERIFWGEDLILNLHLCSRCETFRIIPDVLYSYRQSSGGTKRFSRNTMKDLNEIKKYQLQFLEQYSEGQKDKMLRTLFTEVAGWFFVYIQQALDHLDDREIRELITESLALPSFQLAREYYVVNTEDTREEVCLLREGDVDAYLEQAKAKHSRISVKERLVRILKDIYMSI